MKIIKSHYLTTDYSPSIEDYFDYTDDEILNQTSDILANTDWEWQEAKSKNAQK